VFAVIYSQQQQQSEQSPEAMYTLVLEPFLLIASCGTVTHYLYRACDDHYNNSLPPIASDLSHLVE